MRPSLSSLVRSVLLSEGRTRSPIDPIAALRQISDASLSAHERILGRGHPATFGYETGLLDTKGGKIEMDEMGRVVLRRVAKDRTGVLKSDSSRRASLSDLIRQSMFHGGGGDSDAISLSLSHDFTAGYSTQRWDGIRAVGTFHVPLASLLDMISRGVATIGNMGESEIVASGSEMAPYLTDVSQQGDPDAGAISVDDHPTGETDSMQAVSGEDLPPPPSEIISVY